METKLARISQLSKENPDMVFTSLGHLINKEMLKSCHAQMDGTKAVGIDGITKEEYGRRLEESNMTVEKPRLIKQNRYLDFGFGFYTTTNRDQAVNFAQKVTERRKTGKATLNIYSVDENIAFEECSLLRFDNPDEIWLDFVAENRQGTYQEKQYDLIYGAVANDDVYRTITLYMTGVLDKAQTLMALKIRKLFNQLVFENSRGQTP